MSGKNYTKSTNFIIKIVYFKIIDEVCDRNKSTKKIVGKFVHNGIINTEIPVKSKIRKIILKTICEDIQESCKYRFDYYHYKSNPKKIIIKFKYGETYPIIEINSKNATYRTTKKINYKQSKYINKKYKCILF